MAELFGIATGAISVAGFAGQLAQSTAFLYGFISDIKGAPDKVRALSKELRILGSILANIRTPTSSQSDALEEALKYCESCLNKLLEFIKKIDPNQYEKRKKRLWAKFKVAMKKSDLTTYLGELQRAESMLQQACANVTRHEQMDHSNTLQTIHTSLTALSANQQACSTTTTQMQHTMEEIRDTSSTLMSSSTRIVEVTNETNTYMGKLVYSTEQIRGMTEKITDAAQNLAQEARVYQPRMRDILEEAVDCAVKKSLKHHFEQYSRSRMTEPELINTLNENGGSYRQITDTTRAVTPMTSLPRDEECILRTASGDPADSWIKQSLVETRSHLTRNNTIGTISIRTTTVSYARKRAENHQTETKQISTTTVIILPAPWLTHRGSVFRYESTEFSSPLGKRYIPHWWLSSVNIIPWYSEIFEACSRHDLSTVRNLFDRGHASPYDVDENGRNLLAYVAIGTNFPYFHGKHKNLRERVEDLHALIILLIKFGVDPGSIDLHNTVPVSLFVDCWSTGSSTARSMNLYEDHFRYLFNKLLKSAKADPFSLSDALVKINHSGEHILWHFPGCDIYGPYRTTSPSELGLLMEQKEWEITWDRDQLDHLCSPTQFPPLESIEEVRADVSFWVTAASDQIERYLDTKLDLIKRFLSLGILSLTPGASHCVIEALHNTIHEGGEVIALLSEHSYGSRGKQPWIRQRFKKLVLIRTWLIEVFKALLSSGSEYIAASPYVMDMLCEHAQRHNARTLSAWMESLRALSDDQNQRNTPEVEPRDSGDENRMTAGNEGSVENTDEGWETEDTESRVSDWETEEEWEEGYWLQTAIDREDHDERNPQIKDEDRHTCGNYSMDYDEGYWQHIYPRILGPGIDPVSKAPSEGKLRRLAGYARDFLAGIV